VPDVISNSSPLQYLYQADVLDLLPALFGQVCVPEAVVAELEEGRRRSVPLPPLAELSWLQVRTVRSRTLLPLVTHLGDGEKEVLALGRELSDALLLDDRDARRYAHALELAISGTLGVLLLAKERGILDAVRPVLDRLQALQFRLDASTRQSVLELAGEVTGSGRVKPRRAPAFGPANIGKSKGLFHCWRVLPCRPPCATGSNLPAVLPSARRAAGADRAQAAYARRSATFNPGQLRRGDGGHTAADCRVQEASIRIVVRKHDTATAA